ncbi:MAG: helix-turn-helix domain-containing protein [Lachnospiraceae bacterium]|nr:helix-turn-helix domain-containing protein [Lachnospiraceae bacterium]
MTYSIEDLFDKRSVVGAKLEQLFTEKKYTKAEICRQAEISRPTLDKILAGTSTSKTNYEKHISKLLNYLGITPDILLGNSGNTGNLTRKIRNFLKLTIEKIAEITGISQERLTEIEAGEKATVAELRDIALCLSTSTKALTGEYFFDPQIADMDYFVSFSENSDVGEFSGFWGHIGILASNTDLWLWFPVTANAKEKLYSQMQERRIVIPCMNNKVLFLNLDNIKELMLVDEACDQPSGVNWDPDISSGEIALAAYEALEDYYFQEDPEQQKDILSPLCVSFLNELTKKYGWSDDAVSELLHTTIIHYNDGKTREVCVDFGQSENLVSEIQTTYDFCDSDLYDDILSFVDMDDFESILNMKNISLLELPFVDLENAICQSFAEINKLE